MFHSLIRIVVQLQSPLIICIRDGRRFQVTINDWKHLRLTQKSCDLIGIVGWVGMDQTVRRVTLYLVNGLLQEPHDGFVFAQRILRLTFV